MEELLEILRDIDPDVDYEAETDLVDGRVLGSFAIVTLITEICDRFDIRIGPRWMRNENFNSVKAMWEMICAIRDGE